MKICMSTIVPLLNHDFCHIQASRKQNFPCISSHLVVIVFQDILVEISMSLVMRKPTFFAYAKTKTQISFAVTASLLS